MSIIKRKEDILLNCVEEKEYYRFQYGFIIHLAKKEYETKSKDELIKKLNKIIINQTEEARKKALFITGI